MQRGAAAGGRQRQRCTSARAFAHHGGLVAVRVAAAGGGLRRLYCVRRGATRGFPPVRGEERMFATDAECREGLVSDLSALACECVHVEGRVCTAVVGERVRWLSSVFRVCDSDGASRGRYFNAQTPIRRPYDPHHASRCMQLFACSAVAAQKQRGRG